jgi:hypothetical protein
MHKIGDRVTRWRVSVHEAQRYGSVVEIYTNTPNRTGVVPPTTLYAVRWDDTGEVERGYMAGGLIPVIYIK